MFTKSILTAAAIALVAGVGSAAADEITGSSGGFTEFHTLAGVQAVPLDTDEMASVTAAHWLNVHKNGKVTQLNGHLEHYVHGGEASHGIKITGGGPAEYVDLSPLNVVCPALIGPCLIHLNNL